jgi:hypothetical protein
LTPLFENNSQQRQKTQSRLKTRFNRYNRNGTFGSPIHALDSPPLDFAKERGAIASQGMGLWVWMGRTLTRR